MKGYLDSLDVANRACQHMGCSRISSLDEDSVQNAELSFVYDKLRRAELRRNSWKFAIRKTALRAIDTNTALLAPALWDASVRYRYGAVVKDANGDFWTSVVPDNFNNEPLTSAAWEAYMGPKTVSLYDEDIAYMPGELVYKETGDAGSYVVFLSLEANNEDDPTTATAYDATVTYRKDDVVRSGGANWRSLLDINTGITPAEGPAAWDADAAYTVGNEVTASDGFQYTAAGSTSGDDPVTDDGTNWTASGVATAWTEEPEQYTSSKKWLPLFAAVDTLRILYPIGAGPRSDTASNNVYMLPAGFLRLVKQNPKEESARDPYELEGNLLVSRNVTAIVLRFVADVTDVRTMDDMFCEGLAARCAYECVEKVTQSGSKKKDIANTYSTWMAEARKVNAIEMGPDEVDEDEYISCRI